MQEKGRSLAQDIYGHLSDDLTAAARWRGQRTNCLVMQGILRIANSIHKSLPAFHFVRIAFNYYDNFHRAARM